MRIKPILPSRFLAVVMVLMVMGLTSCASFSVSAPSSPQIQTTFGQMPLYFIENKGQVEEQVAYYVLGRDTNLYFTAQGITFTLSDIGTHGNSWDSLQSPPKSAESMDEHQRWSLRLDFVGADLSLLPVGQDLTSAVISYFRGPRDHWDTGLSTYASLVYADVWPGIDIIYAGTVNRLKYTFVINPGADPSRIRLAYTGATGVKINESGQIEVSTPIGGLHDDIPHAYQVLDEGHVDVSVAFDLESRDADDSYARSYVYGFDVGTYDETKPLVIDPAILVYSGFIGGADEDFGYGIAVDNDGNAYLTGTTPSNEASFPVSVGPDLTYNGTGPVYGDAYVVKVNASGNGLVYAGYIGGAGSDIGRSIAVDNAGNAYVTGYTGSSESTFPVIVGPDLTYNGSTYDAFVAKLNAAGTELVYSGYIGGDGSDNGWDIALDGAGNAYIGGTTASPEATFPEVIGPDLTFDGITYSTADAFIAKVNVAGTGLVYAGYIGGSGEERGHGIAVDAAGNAYVTGATDSSPASFPALIGPDLTFNGGLYDAFVVKVNTGGTGFTYGGYIGGNAEDEGFGMTVDSTGNAYITGWTASSEATFPVMGGPDLTFNGGSYDAFVAKINQTGTGLIYAGYIGGIGNDVGLGIAVDALENTYVGGFTGSSETTFPVVEGPDLTFNGGSGDGFVTNLSASGTQIVYSGYIGGAGGEEVRAIALDSIGAVYLTGYTSSSEPSFTTVVGPDLSFNGGFDAFVAKISYLPPTPTPTATDTPSPTSTDTPIPTPTDTPIPPTPTPDPFAGFHAHYACRRDLTGDLRDLGVDVIPGQQPPSCPNNSTRIQILVKH